MDEPIVTSFDYSEDELEYLRGDLLRLRIPKPFDSRDREDLGRYIIRIVGLWNIEGISSSDSGNFERNQLEEYIDLIESEKDERYQRSLNSENSSDSDDSDDPKIFAKKVTIHIDTSGSYLLGWEIFGTDADGGAAKSYYNQFFAEEADAARQVQEEDIPIFQVILRFSHGDYGTESSWDEMPEMLGNTLWSSIDEAVENGEALLAGTNNRVSIKFTPGLNNVTRSRIALTVDMASSIVENSEEVWKSHTGSSEKFRFTHDGEKFILEDNSYKFYGETTWLLALFVLAGGTLSLEGNELIVGYSGLMKKVGRGTKLYLDYQLPTEYPLTGEHIQAFVAKRGSSRIIRARAL